MDSPIGKVVVSAVYEGGAAERHGKWASFTLFGVVRKGISTNNLPIKVDDGGPKRAPWWHLPSVSWLLVCA